MSDIHPLLYCPVCKGTNVEKRGYSEGEVPKQRLVCKDCPKWFQLELRYRKEDSWELTKDQIKELLGTAETYIITCAQNNTPLDRKFWRALRNLAELYGAQLLVIPVMYRNPNKIAELETGEAWWPEEVIPHLIGNNFQLCKGLQILGGAGVTATAPNPLSGMETITRGDSAIVGHSQIQQRVIATPQHSFPKIMLTTGSVSVKNYSKKKTGLKAAHHHSLGAVVVEKEKDFFHIRSIVGDDRSECYDLDVHATAEGVRYLDRIDGLVTGDEHHRFHCADVRRATFDAPDSIVKVLRPRKIVRHDIIDSYSISHHHRGKPATNYEKWLNGTNSLEAELKLTAQFLEETTPPDCENVIIASNHHEHISRWLDEGDPKTEPWNAILFHELSAARLRHIRDRKGHFEPLSYWMGENCSAPCVFVKRFDKHIIQGILVSMHGDKGNNGARGSLAGLSKMGVKTVVGHTHTPAIEKGCYVVGTSSIRDLEYSKDGPSSWLNTHCLIFPNGKRQLVNIIRGQWRKNRSLKNAA